MKNKTKRWANPVEFEYYSRGYSIKALCRILQRTPRTITDWQAGTRPIPSWAPELFRLRKFRLRNIKADIYRRQLEAMRYEKQRQKIAPTDLSGATSCG